MKLNEILGSNEKPINFRTDDYKESQSPIIQLFNQKLGKTIQNDDHNSFQQPIFLVKTKVEESGTYSKTLKTIVRIKGGDERKFDVVELPFFEKIKEKEKNRPVQHMVLK